IPAHFFYTACQQEHIIWFGASRGKIWKYNTKDEYFELKEFPVTSDINTILPLSEEELIISSKGDGFFTYHTTSGKTTYYNQSNSRLPGNTILSMYVSGQKEVWMDIAEATGITHFKPKTGSIEHKIIYTEKGSAERSDLKFHIHEDVNGLLWIHPHGGGFSVYDYARGYLMPFYNEPGAKDWRFSNKIHSVYSDKAGNLWMCTHSKGLEKVSFFPRAFRLSKAEELSYESLTNDARCIYEDHKQRLWVGSRDGKIRVYEKEAYIGYLTQDGKISHTGPQADGVAYHIMQDKENAFWISTKGEGILKLTESGKQFNLSYFKHDPDDSYSLSDNNVYWTHVTPEGPIWVATFGGGLNYIPDSKQEKPRFIHPGNELKNWPIQHCYRVRVVTSDKQGTIWAGTTSGAVSFKPDYSDPASIEFQHHYRNKEEATSLSGNDIYSILTTQSGEVFLATFGGGLNKATIREDGTTGFLHYTMKNGLPSNVLLSLQEDETGNIWISTENGLCKFDPRIEYAEMYDDNDFNMHITFNEASSTIRRGSKSILFGTTNGILYFRPDSARKSTFIPPVVFTGFLLANNEVTPNPDSVLKQAIDETEHIRLSPKQNIFTLRYAALDMQAPEKIQYAYLLEGFEKDWNYIDKLRSVTYTNLPKGEYTLKVRSTNSDGLWVDNTREMKITILPTFWETPWGILVFVLFILLIIFITVSILFTIYRLKHKVKMEQQISDIKLRFFTNISHELRTPLTLIAGPVEHVLSHEPMTLEAREQLQIVERNTNRMLRLINQILDFRKIQNKKMKLKVQPLDIVSFVRRVMDNFEALAEEHRIDFILETEVKAITLWLDMDKLEKIVFNLVSNAFKYTPADKMIKVIIREDEETVSLGVEDQGIGIAENRRESIFERFENLMDKNIFDQSSTGIGLSLVKELVDIHKATISVDSTLDKGSLFTVVFRKGKEHYEADTEFILTDSYSELTISLKPETEFIPTVAMGETYEEEPENIGKDLMLVVEDNTELRRFLVAIFRSSFRVIEAADGVEGLQKAIQTIPDIIVSDVMMPGRNGIELIQQIRENISTSHIPVVLLSAKATIESRLKGLKYGANDYITKPFSSTYLQARVNNLLEQRKTLQTLYRQDKKQTQEVIPPAQQQPELSPNDRKFMDKLFVLMEDNMDNGDLIVDDLVKELAVSRSVFFKKLKALTGLAPVEFIKEVRIKRAASLIEENEYTMTQISYMVGINDSRYFSKCFKQIYGMTPTEYKEQFLHGSSQNLHK
ncbi:MAG: response regulator, partial [Tannerellaceae bacterium]|nr:response regulator [Tannerellaceae bacterium]